MLPYPLTLPALCGLCLGLASAALDPFGITELRPTRAGTREWTSAHWANGTPRRVAYDGDPFDPTGWTDNHSSGSSDSLYVDGKGAMRLTGQGPRFHINSLLSAKVPAQKFVNVEATGYFRRLTAGGPAYAGAEIQVRTGPLAHGSSGGDVCDATGYAARFRDDGTWDFEKELKHPGSGVYSTRAGSGAPLFGGKTIPLKKWIGMKFLAYNLEDGTRVRLELFIDTVSDVSEAGPSGGGSWSLVGAMTDDGTGFPSGDVSGCPDLTPKMAITTGHGTVLIRTDEESCEWKMLSVREIEAGSTTGLRTRPERETPPRLLPLDGHDALGRAAVPAFMP